MNTERVEAAAKALRELEGEKQTPWEELDYRIKTVWIGRARAALAAADSASGERDIRTPVKVAPNSTAGVCVLLTYLSGLVEGVSQELYIAPGEELVVRKVRTNG